MRDHVENAPEFDPYAVVNLVWWELYRAGLVKRLDAADLGRMRDAAAELLDALGVRPVTTPETD